ncbi:MAG TPA: transglutaminase family protein [Pseudomonadales bacterium]|nr:transglutaminase family protein [Pseudomonadales bacterium]HNH18434.1 transglutaminase family protein [Pseudomonadales bacterium]HNN35440.1 transglutaminase family protein [Pseudomonadales bacterium]
MSIRVAIEHHTHYRFDRPVQLSPHIFRLRPAVHSRTPIEGYSLKIGPAEHFINWQQDPFGNHLARVVFPEKVRELDVRVEVIARLQVINPFDFFYDEYANSFPFDYPPALKKELAPYLEINESGPLLMHWVGQIGREPCRTTDFLVDLNQRLYRDINYTLRMEPGIQRCDETLEKRLGSCRDSGWLLVQILRHLGLAARFVSGYLVQLTADVKSLDGPSGPEQDFTDLHAWCEVYIPGAGWIGLDPTSGLLAAEGHIPLACTASPESAAPVFGYSDECETEFSFLNRVTRIHEDPRVTRPYSEEEWCSIDQLGDEVEQRLQQQGVQLTMGGEPTFVSIDDMEGAEWNIAADGSHKRVLARNLLDRLSTRFATGSLRHYGQGKWYPGEPLPRWAYNCFWRSDGVPVWHEPRLLADPASAGQHGIHDARTFAEALCQRLQLDGRHLLPAFEDTAYYLWREGNLPINLDPAKAALDDEHERRRLLALLDRGLGEPTGYALPLQWDWRRQCWRSGPWQFRRGQLFLAPGDSPMGLRLPLDALPWVDQALRRTTERHPRSLFEPLPELGDIHGEVARRYSYVQHPPDLHPEIHPQAPVDAEEDENGSPQWVEVPHTAICIEVRDGRLCLFMPPITHLEHYLDLIATIEATARALDLPVLIEGYEPPRDPRLVKLAVTPDPGVIEVNIQPAGSWRELVANTEALYEEAHQSRLGTEKFMLDGRHTGTGGGNHVTLGGRTPAESPILRRPDLLRSLITFWQHHPGLSYLFSGQFIGPTSQAPRVDEGRHETLYELEIAFSQMPTGEVPQPWLVDRLLRNLLVDLTGNTHRAEFCIDKLYSPDSATGRLGLLEFRGFEMPPHARMSLVQMLLLRSLLLCFWERPYQQPLVRWGTELHDRFLLPHFIWRDLADVAQFLRDARLPFEQKWLEPFWEFRFPHYGSVSIQGIEIELRMAIEPWHVLGEEMALGGTARYTDSSLERLQVRVSGLTDGRYILACNGRQVPLAGTGTHGEYVAGVRYRAWQPPSALHPTIGIHSPLVFDLIDSWNGRSIGGCTYHVSHPGGLSYERFPVNAYEAESRRVSRFAGFGHTPGVLQPPPAVGGVSRFEPRGSGVESMKPPPQERNREYPYTLDLRRPTSFQ